MLNSVIDAGELRQKMVIQKRVEGVDANGFDIEEYEDVYTLRCKVKTMKAKESVKADKDNTTLTLKFICRKRDIDHKMIILYKHNRFNISNIHELDDFFLELTADMPY